MCKLMMEESIGSLPWRSPYCPTTTGTTSTTITTTTISSTNLVLDTMALLLANTTTTSSCYYKQHTVHSTGLHTAHCVTQWLLRGRNKLPPLSSSSCHGWGRYQTQASLKPPIHCYRGSTTSSNRTGHQMGILHSFSSFFSLCLCTGILNPDQCLTTLSRQKSFVKEILERLWKNALPFAGIIWGPK